MSKTVAYQKSYEKQTPCGGWIPWRMCTTTYYKEEYHPIMVQEAVIVTDCCAGYERVGLYCSLRKYDTMKRLWPMNCKTNNIFNYNIESES